MTTFSEEQTARDLIIERAINDGHATAPGVADECRRWSLCGDCETESEEMRTLAQQMAWEDDHTVWYCERRFDEPTQFDPEEPGWFPLPHIPAFARRLEPLQKVEHITVHENPSYIPTRAPQDMLRRRAA